MLFRSGRNLLMAVLCSWGFSLAACSAKPSAGDAGTPDATDIVVPPDASTNTGNDAGVTPDAGTPDSGPVEATDGGSTDGGTADPGTFKSAGYDAWCDYMIRCNLFPTLDKPACLAALPYFVGTHQPSTFNTIEAIVAAAQAGHATFVPSAVRPCQDQLRAAACSPAISRFDDVPACRNVFTGNVKQGDACIHDLECGRGYFCLGTPNSQGPVCAGTCQAIGVRCVRDTDCLPDEYCNSTSTCVTDPAPPGVVDQVCGTHDRCQADLGCFTNTTTTPPKKECKALGTSGGACADNGACAAGYVCADDGTGKTCHLEDTRPRMVGETCDPDQRGPVCEAGLYCIPSDDLTTGSCGVSKRQAEHCDKLFECGGKYSNSICDLAQHSCTDRPSSAQCPAPRFTACKMTDAYCDVSASPPVCVAFKGPGGACTHDYECGTPLIGAKCGSDKKCQPVPQPQICSP